MCGTGLGRLRCGSTRLAWPDTVPMLRSVVTASGLRVEVFHAAGSGHTNQDRWFVQPLEGVLRVAAIDGVTPWRSPRSPGEDAAQWAAAMTLGALALPLDPDSALRRANALVHNREVAPSRRQAMAAAAVADCRRDGARVHWSAVVAADCEIWVADSRESVLQLSCGGEFLRPEVLHSWTKELAAHGAAWTFDGRLTREAELLEDPATQVQHAVGRYPAPVFDKADGAAGVVVLASDGGRLLEAAGHGVSVAELPAWLQSVVERPPRDDLTCLIVEVSNPAD